jgi:hypothetical protein
VSGHFIGPSTCLRVELHLIHAWLHRVLEAETRLFGHTNILHRIASDVGVQAFSALIELLGVGAATDVFADVLDAHGG